MLFLTALIAIMAALGAALSFYNGLWLSGLIMAVICLGAVYYHVNERESR